MRRIFSCDLETTTKEEDCRVYACGCVEVGKEDSFWWVKSLDEFFRNLGVIDSLVYFHNLKFDGEFIINWLFQQGFRYVDDRKKAHRYSFTTLIDDMGNFYSMEIFFGGTSMEIRDSLKVLPFSVESMPKTFGMDIKKLGETYDYDKERPIGYELSKDEVRYLKHDVIIVSRALEFIFNQDMTRLTTASNALYNYKSLFSKSEWKALYPNPDIKQDEFIRKSYKGGYTYLNPLYIGKNIKDEIVLDVNSLYPSVMYYCMLPFGKPKTFEGRYREDKEYPLFVQKFRCNFLIKDGKLPTLQIKNCGRFVPTQYLESSNDDIVELTMTSVDLELFLEHYEVYDITWIGGYKFRQTNKLFKEYIDYWISIKNQSTINGNKGMRTLAKLMLNSLYGKFATNPKGDKKIPFFDEKEDRVRYTIVTGEERETLYIPIATFITAYAKRKTIETSQKIKDYSMEKYGKDMYIYSDTDSIHTTLSIEEVKKFIDIDKVKLGAWDFEGHFNHARYLRAKTYIQTQDKKRLEITCAGMPESCYKEVTWENFIQGTSYSGKLQSKRVRGGMILKETDFSIK